MEPRGLRLGAHPDLGEALRGGPGGFLKGGRGGSPKGAGLGVSPRGVGLGGYPRGDGLVGYRRVAGQGVGLKPGLEEAVTRVHLKAGLDPGMHRAERGPRGRPRADPDSTRHRVPGDPSVPLSPKPFP